MEFNIYFLFGIAIVIMSIVFIAFFVIKASTVFHDLRTNIGRIVCGSLVAGIGTGTLLGLLLACLFPTYHYVLDISDNGHTTKYVMNEEFFNEFGRKYVLNLTDMDLYFVGMEYGDKKIKDDDSFITALNPGYITQISHDIDAWFQAFPDQVKTKDSGSIRWNVLTKEQTISEFKKIDVEIEL